MHTENNSSYSVPVGSIELVLSKLWSEVLGRGRIGRFDHFFENGGSEQTAEIVISGIHRALGVKLTVVTFRSAPTVCELARHVRIRRRLAFASMGKADRHSPIPLSFAQQRLWFLSRLAETGAAYHVPVGFRLVGRLDEVTLGRSLDALVARHEILRTTFVALDGEGSQRIGSAESGFTLERYDLRKEADQADRLAVLMVDEAAAPFDLERGPLVRGRLIRVSADEHVLLITMHHIVSDGWSIGILMREWSTLYGAFLSGEADPLKPLPIQYADYAAWQRRWFSTEVLAEQGAYWRETLAGVPAVLDLPTDYKRPTQQTFNGGYIELEFDQVMTANLKALSQRRGTTLFMMVLAAWAVVLSRLSGQDDVVIGTPSTNRTRPEVEGLIGFFVNTLVLRIDLSGTPTVEELLDRVRSTVLAAQEHQDLPFEQIVEQANPVRSLAHTPLFQVMFVWQNNDASTFQLPELEVYEVSLPSPVAKFDLTLVLTEMGGHISGGLIYATSLFGADTAKRYSGYLRQVITQLVEHPTQLVTAVPLLPLEERYRLLVENNKTMLDYRQDLCIHELFEEQVKRDPGAVALVFENAALSYHELNCRANRLARHLRSLGISPDDRVAICVERSLEMVIALFGILKAGGAYLPLDPAYPVDRLADIVQDSAPVVILSHSPSLPALVAALATLREPPLIIDLEADAALWASQSSEVLDPASLGLTSRNLAYVIYTSGSTGRPKGVMVEHRNLVAVRSAYKQPYELRAGLTHLQMASIAFDVFPADVIRSLTFGGTLVICPRHSMVDPSALVEALRRHAIDIAEFVPVSLAQLMTYLERVGGDLSLMKVIICSSDLWAAEDGRRLRRLCGPNVRILNSFGVTEATIDSTYFCLNENTNMVSPTVPIGRPLSNTRIYVLNEAFEPVPQGVTGEVYIGGAGVARGYLNRAQLTMERFISSPFVAGDRLYKTGDLARLLPDGEIEFLGRNDFQVKIRGFRIELGEIEARLAEHPQVLQAVVLAREDTSGDKRLVGYYTAESEIAPDLLRTHLSRVLPEYMVPAAYVRLLELPVTPNGKLDRKALPAPGGNAYETRGYIKPEGPVETEIATIWGTMLGLERIGRSDNFFELGGHSLLAVKLAWRIMELVGVDIPLRVMFEHPTIAELADFIFCALERDLESLA